MDTAEQVTNSRPLEVMARAGFAVSGILHFLVGSIAIRLAMGGSGKADVSGAVQELAGQPAGPVLLWSSFAACLALTLWQISDAIFGFGHLPKRKKVGQKLKAAGQAAVTSPSRGRSLPLRWERGQTTARQPPTSPSP